MPRTFWRDWTAAIKRSYPKLNVVGEVFDDDPAVEAFFQGGKARFDGVDSGVDTLFDFPLQAVVTRVFNGAGNMVDLAKLMAHDWLYNDPMRLVTFVGLHDQRRFVNLKGATPDSLTRAVAFLLRRAAFR